MMRLARVTRRVEADPEEASMQRIVVASLAAAVAMVTATTSAASPKLDPLALAHARKIKADVSARYMRPGGPRLTVTEASSTGVIESYLLLTARLDELRVVSADNGIYYAICPMRATCPYPGMHVARPPTAFNPRRLALELALRTFLETSASLVAVSLPTERFILFIVERDELAREVDMPALAKALGGNPARALASSLRRVVDEITRPRLFVPLRLEPTPSGRQSLGAIPLWPEV
jgi:hypothetical protein